MRNRPLGSLAALIITAHLAVAQPPSGWTVPPLPQSDVTGLGPAWVDGEIGAPPGPSPVRERAWVTAEPLWWWFKSSPFPVPLVTTTTDPNAQPLAALGPSTTSVLLGNQEAEPGARLGARFTAGYWCDERSTIGFEGSYFFVSSRSVTRQVSSSGQPDSPILAIPYVDGDTLTESTFVLASPGMTAGSATLSLTSRLQGAEVNGLVNVLSSPTARVSVLAGFRFLDLRENATFATVSTGTQDPGDGSNNGLILNTTDQFDTRNQFYGCQIGARAEYQWEGFYLDTCAKIACGNTHQVVTITGSATTNFFNAPPGGPFTGVPAQALPGSGVFGQPSNAGRTSRDEMALAPQVTAHVGYQFTQGLRGFIGYDFLYLSNVARPGNQIDRVINVEQTVQSVIAGNPPGTGPRPAANVTGSSFWAQGINLGLQLSF